MGDVDATTVVGWAPSGSAGSAGTEWIDLPPAGGAAATDRDEGMSGTLARDEQVFASVFHEEHDRAMRLAGLLAGDRDLAEDAVAEAFVRTFERWRAGKIDRVGPYLRQAVVNQIKNQRRSLARRRRHEERKRADDRGQPPTAEHVAVRETVEALLERLPYRQRAAIVLRYYEELSEAETAEALGCRPGTVKSLVSRGMDALRSHLSADELERADIQGGS